MAMSWLEFEEMVSEMLKILIKESVKERKLRLLSAFPSLAGAVGFLRTRYAQDYSGAQCAKALSLNHRHGAYCSSL